MLILKNQQNTFDKKLKFFYTAAFAGGFENGS